MGCREEKKKPTLVGGPSRTEVEGRDKENLLSERSNTKRVSNFPASRNAGQAQRVQS